MLCFVLIKQLQKLRILNFLINLIKFVYDCLKYQIKIYSEMQQNIKEQKQTSISAQINKFQLKFQNLEVQATVDEEIQLPNGTKQKQTIKKKILHSCEGIFSPNTFTAIVGPSGCGKTTLLNLLSGRLLSKNLKLNGKIFVNSYPVHDINQFGDKIGYVMQEDLLFATFSPRQCFQFIANMRLVNLTSQEKSQRVQEIIKVLGLTKCADTYVGNNLIRGISGGEKKRTSIGVQLLTNPSILFLDQPTTGLDSTTALHVIRFLNKLAKSGRTIISTIHQPSSQIFAEFDRLIIMVQGHIVYQDNSKKSVQYFKRINFSVPPNSNPTDFYMKIMNKQGITMKYIEQRKAYTQEQIKIQFQQRVNYFIKCYQDQKKKEPFTITQQLKSSESQGYLPFYSQFYYIFIRAWKNQIRNPLDVKLKLIQQIIFALICIILYYQKSDIPYNQRQNVAGCLFLFLFTTVFSGILGALSTFNVQKSIFIRERMNNTYTTSGYFWGRSTATIPFQLVFPFIFVCICYFACNLNNDPQVFWYCILAVELTYWFAASYGFFLSTVFNDLSLAIAMIPVLIVPLFLVAGFFTNLNNVPKVFYPLQYISMFKYGFQALIQNNYPNNIDCGPPFKAPCNVLQQYYNFAEPFWLNLLLLFAIGLGLRILALIGLYLLSNPQRVKIDQQQADKNQISKSKLQT